MLKHRYGIWENGFNADRLEFLRKIWIGTRRSFLSIKERVGFRSLFLFEKGLDNLLLV